MPDTARGSRPLTAEARQAFLAWPGWRHLVVAWALSLANGVWFGLVFIGCDWLTALHSRAGMLPVQPSRSAGWESSFGVAGDLRHAQS